VAAGLVLVLGSAMVLTPWGGGSRVAFADVIEQVNQVQAMKCKMSLDVEVPGQARTRTEMDMLMTASGVAIVSTPDMKVINNPKEGKMLMLMEKSKEAMLLDIKRDNPPASGGTVKGAPNLLQLFRGMTPAGSTVLGEKDIGGVKARGFRREKDRSIVEVWADVKTERPVLVTIAVDDPKLPSALYTFKDFDWKPVIEETEEALKVPEGYTVVNSTFDLSQLAEHDVLGMLAQLAEFNHGVLPDHIDMRSATYLAGKYGGELAAARGVADKELQQEFMMKMVPVGRAWAYMANPTNGSDWYYNGAGARIGDKGRSVVWYRPVAEAGKPRMWRVIDADLSIHEQADAPAGGEMVTIDVKSMMGVPAGGTSNPQLP
jgi:hypothetical protein